MRTIRDTIGHGLKKLGQGVDALGDKITDQPTATIPQLLPLSPQFDKDKHGLYVELLEKALEPASSSRNIALAGSYGVGKRSILAAIEDKYQKKTVSVSLLTLASDSSGSEALDPNSRGGRDRTNNIQKEIVKQILYSERPGRMPGSRYKRVSGFAWWRNLVVAALIAIPLVLTLFLTAWGTALAGLFNLGGLGDLQRHGIYWAVCALSVLMFLRLIHNRIEISQLSAGSASISLSRNSATYFDEYLDEIVYFFESSRKEIVIFEDIDRFNDPRIFETLRTLNGILNDAPQLRRRRIRFIYAIKDSIFDSEGRTYVNSTLDQRLGAALVQAESQGEGTNSNGDEVVGAGRTKFFDLVIPVVPFITHRSARDLMTRILKEHGLDVNSGLIDIVAHRIADMRLIKNICNEFAVFHRQLLPRDESGNVIPSSLGLDADRMFAMITYKNTSLKDFESIKYGESQLDDLNSIARALINKNIRSLSSSLSNDESELQIQSPVAGRGQRLGESLEKTLDLWAKNAETTATAKYVFDAQTLSSERIRDDNLWDEIAKGEGPVRIEWVNQYGQHVWVVSLEKPEIAQIVEDPLHRDDWISIRNALLVARIAESNQRKEFVIQADWKSLLAEPSYQVMVGAHGEKPFSEYLDAIVGTDLVKDLVRAGYIDDNFTLYTSMYHDDLVTAAASKFIRRSVERDVVDANFILSDADVKAILRERPNVAECKASLNISIVNFFVKENWDGLEHILLRLTSEDDESTEFLALYLRNGNEKERLGSQLAAKWAAIFRFLISGLILPEDTTRTFIQIGLMHLSPMIEYEVNEEVRSFIEINYASLEAFTGSPNDVESVAKLEAFMRRGQIKVSHLEELGNSQREAMMRAGMYAVNRGNLENILGPDNTLSLDQIETTNKVAYETVLKDLFAYFDVINDGETISETGDLAHHLRDVRQHDLEWVERLIFQADTSLVVLDLSEVPKETWRPLAQSHRFPTTFGNVHAYIEEQGIDEELAGLLSAKGEISGAEIYDFEEYQKDLALRILTTKEDLLSAEMRARLIESIDLSGWLGADLVPQEHGKLVGYLIEKRIISDDAKAFDRLVKDDAQGFLFAIARSEQFTKFMTPGLVPPNILGSLFGSAENLDKVRSAVVERFVEFAAVTTLRVRIQMARYAQEHGISIPWHVVVGLAQETVDPVFLIGLAEPHLSTVDADEILGFVQLLPEPYSFLAKVNNKRPLISKSAPIETLLVKLRELGTVGSFASEGDMNLRVHMKRKP